MEAYKEMCEEYITHNQLEKYKDKMKYALAL